MVLKKIKLKNFKKYKEHEIQFPGGVYVISGENESGKTTIATAVFWVLTDCDFDLKKNPVVRREVNGAPINDVPVEVELIFTDGTKDISFKKVQKRSIKKDGSYADANTYFVNEVERTMRDFNSYIEESFGCSAKELPMCLNINSFLSQKPDAMRAFLFEHVESKSDLEIAQMEQGLGDLKDLLEKYTLEEVSSLYKASKTKIQKTLDDIPVMIAQERKHIVDLETAEDELAIRSLEKEISMIDHKMSDAQKISSEEKEKADNLISLHFKKSEMEMGTNAELIGNKNAIQKELDKLQTDEFLDIRNIRVAENDLSVAEQELNDHKKELESFRKKYADLVKLEFSEDASFCPTCHQRLPDEDIKKLMLEFEAEKNKKAQFVIERGNSEKQAVKNLADKIPDLKQKIREAQARLLILRGNIENKKAELEALPETVDMGANETYQDLLKQISDAEKSMHAESSVDDVISRLEAQRRELETQLADHRNRVDRVMKNAEHEEEIDRLENLRRKKEQDMADCEKILGQIENLDKKKNELLVSDINSLFSTVKWKLFDYKKNGAYEKCCIPLVDDYEFGKSTNKAREILAKIDIAVSIQEMLGVDIPIVLDNAESLDKVNREKLKGFGRQMILLRVKGD